MANSSIIQINIRKSHLIALTLVILTATTAATVNIRDTTNMFQELNMNNNPITNLQNPTNAQEAATKSYVDNNAGSGGGLDWSTTRQVEDQASGSSATITCNSNEILVDATCFQDQTYDQVDSDPCDSRTERMAENSGGTGSTEVWGICVDKAGGS